MPGTILRMVLTDYGHTKDLDMRPIQKNGISLKKVEIDPIVAAYRSMVRELKYEICELAPATYIAARAAGVPLIAIPAFVNRNFHHGDLVCRPGSGISAPKDLEGRKVGVRAYSVSTGVWIRGMLVDEYGVDLNKVTWVVDDEEHVKDLRLPENVVHVSENTSLSEMFKNGELEAAVKGAAGIGRTGAASKDWEKGGVEHAQYEEIIKDAAVLDEENYRKNHIYPIHGVVVMRQDVARSYPWLPKTLYRELKQAKEVYLSCLKDKKNRTQQDEKILRLQKITGGDPIPYGLDKNRETLEALTRYCFEQKITKRKFQVEELFEDMGGE